MVNDDLPKGISVWPGDGWPVLSMARELSPIPVDVATRLAAPRTFHTMVCNDAEEWSLALLFRIIGGEVLFVGATSEGAELHTLMAQVLRIQPLRWWQSRAFEHVLGHQQESDRANYLEAALREAEVAGDVEPEHAAAELLAQFDASVGKPPPVGRRRNRITPALLAEVAQVYRDAWNRGAPPTQTVTDHFGVKHSTAANWVVRARKEGFLGPADGKRGGES